MKLNKNVIIAIVAGIVLTLAGVAAYLLYGEITKFTEAKDDLGLSVKRLSKFYSMNPFPSESNVEKERENVEALDGWYKELMADLKKGELKIVPRTPAVLLQRLGDTKKMLMRQAVSNNVVLPEEFNFGFARYAQGRLPAPQHVNRLTEQLEIVEILCKGLFAQNVQGITVVEREVFEEKDSPTESSVEGPRGRSRGRVMVSTQPGPVVETGPSLFSKSHFVLEFTAKEMSVIQFLNGLASHGVFFVVTQMEWVSTGTDVKDMKKAGILPGSPDSPKEAKAAISRNMLRMERRVSGKSFEQAMKVRLELDVYGFGEETGK